MKTTVGQKSCGQMGAKDHGQGNTTEHIRLTEEAGVTLLGKLKVNTQGERKTKKSTCPGNTYAQERPEKMLHFHVGLINEGFPPYTVSVQRLGEFVIFSNVQFSTKDHKAYKHMLGLPWWSSR